MLHWLGLKFFFRLTYTYFLETSLFALSFDLVPANFHLTIITKIFIQN